ncbi:hypothetical protein SAMN02745225_01130 [Ferrithrix thermotolerans DSM 19514]|uniref:Uncharacterized protein n=1 Tax=Ferrithrix thermotolerans DSM 19514 TaxID=1121881 RepID=A0A1M4UZB9_9ACTN|nr:hypothetical protein SAMN02745225_01130 [Ferrithrix thermotolerans DSM 19514]
MGRDYDLLFGAVNLGYCTKIASDPSIPTNEVSSGSSLVDGDSSRDRFESFDSKVVVRATKGDDGFPYQSLK